jgi:hypothetical protein
LQKKGDLMGIRDQFKVNKNEVKDQIKAYRESRVYKPSNYATYFELGNGMQQFLWKATEKGTTYNVDVVPWIVSPDYPFPDKMLGAAGAPKPGTSWFCLDLHIHQNIGPANERVVCPKHSFKNGIAKGDRPGCPICEDLQRRQEKLKDDKPERIKVWNKLKYMRRNLYNIIVRDDGEEEDKGVQLFEVAHMYFQDQIDILLEDEDDGVSTWWDIDDGKLVQFKVFKQGDDQAPDIKVVKTKDRDYEIEDEDLEDSVTPQQWIKYYSYDELYQLHYQSPPEENRTSEPEEDDPPVTERRSRRRVKQEETVRDELPPDDDIPFRDAKGEQGSESECTYGHTFGVDAGDHDDCDNCDDALYKKCLGIKVKGEEKVKEEPPVEEEKPRRTRRSKG